MAVFGGGRLVRRGLGLCSGVGEAFPRAGRRVLGLLRGAGDRRPAGRDVCAGGGGSLAAGVSRWWGLAS